MDWIEWFELLCFIVILKSVLIRPEVKLLLAPRWMVPDGCSAASIPLTPPFPTELLTFFFTATSYYIRIQIVLTWIEWYPCSAVVTELHV